MLKIEKGNIPHSYRYIPEDPVRFGKFVPTIASPAQGDIWKAEYFTWYKKRLSIYDLVEDKIVYLSFDSVNLLSDNCEILETVAV